MTRAVRCDPSVASSCCRVLSGGIASLNPRLTDQRPLRGHLTAASIGREFTAASDGAIPHGRFRFLIPSRKTRNNCFAQTKDYVLMAIRVAAPSQDGISLTTVAVTLLPHIVRLRPAPHCRTPILSLLAEDRADGPFSQLAARSLFSNYLRPPRRQRSRPGSVQGRDRPRRRHGRRSTRSTSSSRNPHEVPRSSTKPRASPRNW